MKDRIYVCHTFYHVYITLLKELALPKEKQGGATLVLSLMSNRFAGLKERAERTGYFEEVIEYDEKRESFFPELAEYKIDRGSVAKNMLQRIRFTKKFAKCQEKFVPVDFKVYKEIYVFCDSDPVGVYLNQKKIYYHAIEDGLDCLKTLDSARVSNQGHFKMKAFFASLNLIHIENGYAKYCIDMEINDRSVLQYDYHKYKEVPRRPLYERLTAEDKELLLRIFVENKEEIEECIRTAKESGKKTVLILSDPLCDLDTRKQIMEDQIAEYGHDDEGKEALVFIKPHPRDLLDYAKYFPQCPLVSSTVPMEVLNFFEGLHFDRAVSVFTELSAIDFAGEKIRLGHDFMDRYEDPLKHRHYLKI